LWASRARAVRRAPLELSDPREYRGTPDRAVHEETRGRRVWKALLVLLAPRALRATQVCRDCLGLWVRLGLLDQQAIVVRLVSPGLLAARAFLLVVEKVVIKRETES